MYCKESETLLGYAVEPLVVAGYLAAMLAVIGNGACALESLTGYLPFSQDSIFNMG